MFSIIR